MKPEFWQQHWCDKQIGFHQDKPTPLMLKHWLRHKKDGPPFSVAEGEVRALYGHDWIIDVLERSDILDAQPDSSPRA